MARDPMEIINRASEFDSLGGLIGSGIGGIILAAVIIVINLGQTIADVVIIPLQSLAVNVARVVTSFVGGGARIISAGVTSTVNSITVGFFNLGPFTFGESVLIVGSGIFAMSVLLQLSPTSNILPFTFTDVPFIGIDEDEEEFPEED